MNQEGKKNNWTACESEIMHFVYSGIKYYEEHPSKADISSEEKKEEIIEALQTLIANNSLLSDIDAELCLELVEGPIISQVLDYSLPIHEYSLGKRSSLPSKKKPSKNHNRFFCCF